jgi:hypothetical protein
MRRDAEKEKFWREAIEEVKMSGQSVRTFCEQRGLKKNSFYSWRRELKLRDAEHERKPGFVELVSQAEKNGGAGVCIRLAGGMSIVLERGFDRETLKAALAVTGEERG